MISIEKKVWGLNELEDQYLWCKCLGLSFECLADHMCDEKVVFIERIIIFSSILDYSNPPTLIVNVKGKSRQKISKKKKKMEMEMDSHLLDIIQKIIIKMMLKIWESEKV